MRRCLVALVLLPALAGAAAAQEPEITVTVTADQADLTSAPVCIPLSVAKEVATFTYARLTGDQHGFDGQLTAPALTTEHIAAAPNLVRRDLHFIVPSLKKGQTLTLKAKLAELDGAPGRSFFNWTPPGEKELIYVVLSDAKQRPVLRYMSAPFDDSSKDARDRTYKVFHHLYDPAGKRLVTNGGHTDLKPGESRKLLFPHHRGIMFGFNKCSYGEGFKKKADTWHCTGDAHVAHEKLLAKEEGSVLGRHRVRIGWHGEKKERFLQEEREITVYSVPGGTLVEFASRLTAPSGPVKLDGDPQHAGFQFRASNDVADPAAAKQTYYLRPDGKGKPGEFRNWDPKTRKGPVDLPWYALSFVLGDQRYTCCYLNHPRNPKEQRFSERDYGRFGGYFEAVVTQKQPLLVNYRLWLQDGEMIGAQAQALHAAFASPAKGAVQ
jgi:hypothetical protein